MTDPVIQDWQEVGPLPPLSPGLDPLLATVDSLRAAWLEFVQGASAETFAENRRRTLRRHAIETGIIERLYDVDWGVTEALVAEGLSLDVAAREGGIDADALATITSQFDALEFLAVAAREGESLSVRFIRELHVAITSHQKTYRARDGLGRVFDAELHHGAWKSTPNWVERSDGSRFNYAPPAQVQSEMDRLVGLYEEVHAGHPVVAAAWLHQAFITIHPFEDGNGRVARALVLLALLRGDYAPLVVDRTRRGDYILALEACNAGDLAPLVRLFAQLEIVALRSELERPAEEALLGRTAVDIAQAYAGRLANLKVGTVQERRAATSGLVTELQTRLRTHLEGVAGELREAFQLVDANARATVISAAPPEDAARFWGAQLIRAARKVDFFTNLSEGSWWVRLHLTVQGLSLRYVLAIQKVGQGETGVLAVTPFAELVLPRGDGEGGSGDMPKSLLEISSADSVTLIHSDTADARWAEVSELLERTLAAAVANFGPELG